MTAAEFYTKLEKLPKKLKTKVKEYIEFPAKTGYSKRPECACPIVVVALHETKQMYLNMAYHEAARAIGLRSRCADLIAGAADDGESAPIVRKKLEKALGMK